MTLVDATKEHCVAWAINEDDETIVVSEACETRVYRWSDSFPGNLKLTHAFFFESTRSPSGPVRNLPPDWMIWAALATLDWTPGPPTQDAADRLKALIKARNPSWTG